MTQLSGKRRERRRRRWYGEERPTLLVRLRLAGAPVAVIDYYKEVTWRQRHALRRTVSYWESLNPPTN